MGVTKNIPNLPRNSPIVFKSTTHWLHTILLWTKDIQVTHTHTLKIFSCRMLVPDPARNWRGVFIEDRGGQ